MRGVTVTAGILILGLAAVVIWLWGKRDVAASVFAGEPTITYKGVVGTTR